MTSEMSKLPKTYKAAVIEEANTPLTLKDVELKMPGHGEVLVKVLVCGVCNSDGTLQEGFWEKSLQVLLSRVPRDSDFIFFSQAYANMPFAVLSSRVTRS